MECNPSFTAVEGEVCLKTDDNPYINKLVGFLLNVDEGVKWNKNFKHFGAAHPQKMTGDEILAALGSTTDRDKANAGAAMLAVLRERRDTGDHYCVAKRFAAKNLEDFVDWSDIEIASLKLGWPVAPGGGADKHN